MSNAAILFHPDAYDTQGAKLMGRQSAGESFLRGFLDHAEVDTFHFWRQGFANAADADALIRRNSDTTKPINWIGARDLGAFRKIGCLYTPQPGNAPEAWRRHVLGSRAYSICGLTHTISSAGIMGVLGDMVLAPVEPWDALICTSTAAKAAIEVLLDGVNDYLASRLGAAKRPPLNLPVIPLGIRASDFTPRPGAREDWRSRLGIPPDAVTALYVGRFSTHAKMNPAPMARALQQAAQQTGCDIHWVLYGQAPTPFNDKLFKGLIADHAPSITTHYVDGRDMDARFSIWPVADLFFSLSDNLQETFGITPLEAMAAGVPAVVSDWDGYRDTVRDGVDGFRIPTLMARPGMGADLAYRHAMEWDNYDVYIGATSLMTHVDIEAAAAAIVRLVEEPDLRRRMGEDAARRAREVFDWQAVIPQYQALWSELADIRAKAPASAPEGVNPWRPEPFRMFAPYPTESLSPDHVVVLNQGAQAQMAVDLLGHNSVGYVGQGLPSAALTQAMFDALAARGPLTVSALAAGFPAQHRDLVARSLLIFAKYGLLRLESGRPAL